MRAVVQRADKGNAKYHVCAYHGWAYDPTGKIVDVKEHKAGQYINGKNDIWHSDITFSETPPLGSVLHCRAAWEGFADTMFSNQYMAYEALSEPFKRMLEGMKAEHDAERQARERKGARVVVNYVGNGKAAQEVVAEIERLLVASNAAAGPAKITEFGPDDDEGSDEEPGLETLARVGVQRCITCVGGHQCTGQRQGQEQRKKTGGAHDSHRLVSVLISGCEQQADSSTKHEGR